MKLIPVLTEKSLQDAESGKYTFWVSKNLNKYQIKKLISEVFAVTVTNVATVNVAGEKKRTMQGRKRIIKPRKKAIVTLKEKEKIDLFEVKKK